MMMNFAGSCGCLTQSGGRCAFSVEESSLSSTVEESSFSIAGGYGQRRHRRWRHGIHRRRTELRNWRHLLAVEPAGPRDDGHWGQVTAHATITHNVISGDAEWETARGYPTAGASLTPFRWHLSRSMARYSSGVCLILPWQKLGSISRASSTQTERSTWDTGRTSGQVVYSCQFCVRHDEFYDSNDEFLKHLKRWALH